MINLLITVLILCIIFGMAFWVLQQFPLPEPWGKIVRAVAVLICLLILISVALGGLTPKLLC